MRKAIQLKVTLWIEDIGDLARDFAPTPTQLLQPILEQGAQAHPTLQITLKHVTEDLRTDSDAALAMDEAKPAEATQVSAVFWIEGEDEPAHDFAQSTIAALQEVIQQGNASDPTVQITIKTIVEDTDEEEDEPLPDQPAPPTTWLMRLKRWFATRWSR